MKKILFLMLLLVPAISWAQKKTQVLVWTSETEYVAFEIGDKPKIEYSYEEIIISTELTSLSIPNNQVIRFTFDDDELTDIADSQMSAQCTIEQNRVMLTNLKPDCRVEVYSVSGAKMLSEKAGKDGEVSFSTEGWHPGVYVVKGKDFSFKFMKK